MLAFAADQPGRGRQSAHLTVWFADETQFSAPNANRTLLFVSLSPAGLRVRGTRPLLTGLKIDLLSSKEGVAAGDGIKSATPGPMEPLWSAAVIGPSAFCRRRDPEGACWMEPLWSGGTAAWAR